ncbi:MAG: hypothetical protein MJ229_04230 [bacterium]|nr:hypothetical protein [bacterium]
MEKLVKKLTGKNRQDFEYAASEIINNSDVQTFSELVDKSDFLFDFIKENVKNRLSNAINENNYKNILNFLSVYSPDYEDVLIYNLVDFEDDEITSCMLEKFKNGTVDEKTYAAKYFSYIKNDEVLPLINENIFSEEEGLMYNCIDALKVYGAGDCYQKAFDMLHSNDVFEQLCAVKFLVAYQDVSVLDELFKAMKKSSMSENIASYIPYLKSFMDMLRGDYKNDMLLALNLILNSLGEVVPLRGIFDYEIYDILSEISTEQNSIAAITMLNAKLRIEQLTENDEYLFDETKDVKDEVFAVKHLLGSFPQNYWDNKIKYLKDELRTESDFIFIALQVQSELEIDDNIDELKALTLSSNPTAALKSVEILKQLNRLGELDSAKILEKIDDENIKTVIKALFN